MQYFAALKVLSTSQCAKPSMKQMQKRTRRRKQRATEKTRSKLPAAWYQKKAKKKRKENWKTIETFTVYECRQISRTVLSYILGSFMDLKICTWASWTPTAVITPILSTHFGNFFGAISSYGLNAHMYFVHCVDGFILFAVGGRVRFLVLVLHVFRTPCGPSQPVYSQYGSVPASFFAATCASHTASSLHYIQGMNIYCH